MIVNMGVPHFSPEDIPFTTNETALTYIVDVADTQVKISALSMGNPHAVQMVDNVDTAPVELQGPLIESHPRFPQRVNAGFMQIINTHHIRFAYSSAGAAKHWLAEQAPVRRR